MAQILEDGSGTGSKVRIDSQNRMYTFSVSESEDRHINISTGKVWSLYAKVTPAGANDYFFYIKNTGSNPLHVTDIRISSTVATELNYRKVTGTPIYISSTDIEIGQRNLGSTSSPEATMKYDTDITGITADGIIFNEFIDTANKLFHLKTTSNIIIPQGSSIAFQRVSATGEITVLVSIVELEPVL